MPCTTGLLPNDCVCDHWAPPLDLRKVGSGWRGTCPLCGAERAVEVSIKGGRALSNVHCECGKAKVDPVLAEKVGSCYPRKLAPRTSRRDLVARSELESLIGLSGKALELRVACLAWDCPPKEAAAKLGMPERTLRWARTQVPR